MPFAAAARVAPVRLFDLGRSIPSDSSALSRTALLLLFGSIYLKDLASAWLTQPAIAVLLALSAVVAIVAMGTRRRRLLGSQHSMQAAAAVIVLWVLTMAVAGGANSSAYYLSVVCAFFIVNTDPRLFFKLIAATAVVALLIQAAEYITGQYLFVFLDSDGNELDEVLFGGATAVFRAKGLSQGPLSAVAFALWVAFSARGHSLAAGLLLITSFLAGGRLGMSIGVLLLSFRLVFSRQHGAIPGLRLLTLGGVLAFVLALVALGDGARSDFIASAYDLDNPQTTSRFYFWLISVDHFLGYAPLELLFGRFGFSLMQEGATENDLLRILLDNGIVGFVPYLAATLAIGWRAIRQRDRELLFVLVLVLVASNIFPFMQSLPSATLFWVFVFCLPKLFPAGEAHVRLDSRRTLGHAKLPTASQV
jgi:O-antigen ligase